jgi:6-phosphofructokinase 1
MTMSGHPDFTIRRLEGPRVRSPLKLSTTAGDQVANFVPEDEAIIFDDAVDRGAARPRAAAMERAGPREFLHFDPRNVRAAIVTCGGLCPGLNDVIRSLVLELYHYYGVREIWGIRYGYWGMIPENGHTAIRLDPSMVESIHHRGGTFLGSSRGPQDIAKMLDFLTAWKINVLFTVGGDGTQRGALALSEAARQRGLDLAVVGIPKTIDNDLAYTERTFGFDTAVATAGEILSAGHAEAMGVRYGVCLVKIMGRESGFIAARASLASGDVNFVLVPEVGVAMDGSHGFLAALEKRIRDRLHALVVVAEGAGQDLLGQSAEGARRDASGNLKLGDIGIYLRDRIQSHFAAKKLPVVVRYIDPSYIIRCTPANASDHIFCATLAQNAVHAAMSGRSDLVISLWHGSFVHVPMATAVSFRKKIDPDGQEWLAVVQGTGQPAVMRAPAPASASARP